MISMGPDSILAQFRIIAKSINLELVQLNKGWFSKSCFSSFLVSYGFSFLGPYTKLFKQKMVIPCDMRWHVSTQNFKE